MAPPTELVSALRAQAARHGRSPLAEVSAILAKAVKAGRPIEPGFLLTGTSNRAGTTDERDQDLERPVERDLR